MIDIQLDTGAVQAELQRLHQRVMQPTRLMAAIAARLESQTQEAFRIEGVVGGPKWAKLADATIAQRLRGRGGKDPQTPSWPGQILTRSGSLRNSVFSASTVTTATLGAGSGRSAAYATIHQFGGQAGRGHRAAIPARPYLPITGRGGSARLSDNAQSAILRMMRSFVDNGQP